MKKDECGTCKEKRERFLVVEIVNAFEGTLAAHLLMSQLERAGSP